MAIDEIQQNFEVFHAEHPEVYELFRRFTHIMIDRGFENGSAKLIFERIRWETAIELRRDPVKLNNNYTSRYARMFENQYPQHRGFFRMRKLQPDSYDSTSRAEEVAPGQMELL